jgi:Tfp pilus assembly protein PilO
MNPKVIAIFVLLAFAGVISYFLVMPKFSEVSDFKDKVKRQEDNLKTVNEKFEATKAAIAKFQTMPGKDRELIDLALPSEEDSPDLYVLVDSLIYSAGLITEDIEIKAGDVNDVDITISAAGSYGSLKAFIFGAQKSLRIFDIESIGISPEEKKEGGSENFKFEINMKTYFE